MWIQKKQRDNRHDLHSRTASGEVPRTDCRSIHDLTSPKLLTQLVVMDSGKSWPPRFIATVRQFYDGMQVHVQNDGEFSVTNVIKQGYVMAPTLFSMMFLPCSWMLFFNECIVSSKS